MFCINCGVKLADGAKFCQECGAKQNYKAEAQAQQAEESISVNPQEVEEKELLFIKLGKETLKFDPHIKFYAEIQKHYFDLSKCEVDIFSKHYDNADVKCLEDVIDKAVPLLTRHMSALIDLGFDRLLECQIHDISKQEYIDKIFEFYDPEEVYQPYIESADAIAQWAETQKIVRNIQKQTRGKWVGGGFGIKGAIKGAVQAGVMNMATNALRGIGDCVISVADKARLEQLKKAAFPDDTKQRFIKGMTDVIAGIKYAEMAIFVEYGILHEIDFDTKQAETVFTNYQRSFLNGIETDKKGLLYAAIQCLNINPFKVVHYGYVYNVAKIYWKQGEITEDFFEDLYALSKNFEMFERCVDYLNKEEHDFFQDLVEKMGDNPEKVEENYSHIKNLLDNVCCINPYFDCESVMDKATIQRDTLKKLLEERKKHEEHHSEFVEEYNRISELFKQGKLEEIWELAKNKNAVAEYILTQYYEKTVFRNAIENNDDDDFAKNIREIKAMGGDSPFARYLSELMIYASLISEGVSGEKTKEIIIKLADAEDACISSVAQTGFWLSHSEAYKTREQEGIEKLKYAAENGSPVAMAWYGSYIIEKSHGVTDDIEYGRMLIKTAVYAGQKYAVKLNEKYGYNYKTYSQDFLEKRINLPAELVAKKSCLKKAGEISFLEGIPQRLISKYEEMFMLENKDVIMNHGKEITLSKELINLRNSFCVPPEEVLFLAISANVFGHFKENMQGIAVGTRGIYYKGTFFSGKGLIPWEKFIKLRIYSKSGFFIGDVGVVSSFDNLLESFFIDLQNECKGVMVEKTPELKSLVQNNEELRNTEFDNTIGRICPQCKKNNVKDTKFCTGCGYSFISQVKCIRCGNVDIAGKRFCRMCGQKLIEDEV